MKSKNLHLYSQMYVISAIVLLGLMVCENALASLPEEKYGFAFDCAAYSFLGAVWIAWHIVLLMLKRRAKQETWKKLRRKQEDGEEGLHYREDPRFEQRSAVLMHHSSMNPISQNF